MMTKTLYCLFAAIILLAGVAAAEEQADRLSSLERDVIREINLARRNPDQYADFLEESKQYYDGKLLQRPGQMPIRTREGLKAVDEAIEFLRAARPLAPLTPSRGMSLGARDHVRDIQAHGVRGHEGSDGSRVSDRVNRHGAWHKTVGENIAYGPGKAREIVMALIVDDGIKDRGHRKNIFKPEYRIIGAACGPEKRYGNVCVMTYAVEYIDRDAKSAGNEG